MNASQRRKQRRRRARRDVRIQQFEQFSATLNPNPVDQVNPFVYIERVRFRDWLMKALFFWRVA